MCAKGSTTSASGTRQTSTSSDDEADNPDGGLKQSDVIAIGVGLGVGIPALIIAFITMCLACPCCPWHKRRKG